MDCVSDAALADHKRDIQLWSRELGFDAIGVSEAELGEAGPALQRWLGRGWHGEMNFMARHADERTDPQLLVPSVFRIISVRLNYWRETACSADTVLGNPRKAYIARYALGRDYHRPMRRKLQRLADLITESIGSFAYRAFVDSAPVMEKPLGQKAGIGWMGKHTNLIHPVDGSWFFLGELYTDLPLPVDQPHVDHCGSCTRCAEECPTNALDTPYQLDARLCIAYLTIEHKSSIPEALRPMIGNRIFGCDDCQLVCPWNKFPGRGDAIFSARHELDDRSLLELFTWSPAQFEEYTRGSAIRRLGYERWMRNLAVALGNGPADEAVIATLRARLGVVSGMVDEHIRWALGRLARKDASASSGDRS
ncbi:MAG TPA: tRNA epoxyqueuosine(34) reductase QueG [Gammaproteobacteria bacterium]|nr:tRNA epoxyqueuosine(34) reductase QueG [Gammaproteobacteria bacterium]